MKESKYITTLLHSFMSKQYQKAVESYYSGYLTVEDIEMYCDFEDTVPQRINTIRENQANIEIEERYKQIVAGDKLPTDDFITRLEEELQILDTEYLRVLKSDAFTPASAKVKKDKLESLEKRIEFYKKQINDLRLSKETIRPKKKPGRPKKGENICTK